MPTPLSEAAAIAGYLARQRLRGRTKYPLFLFLEPLYQCNLACRGCGKIQQPREVLRLRMPVDQAVAASDECGAPIVSIAGGEPLIHRQIHELAAALVERGRYVHLCSNGLLMPKRIGDFTPSHHLTFEVHVDALGDRHDGLVGRPGTFDRAVEAIRLYKEAGFRVSTNTTVYLGTDGHEVRELLDFLTGLGVDGLVVSPGYAYESAPDQEHFLELEQTRALFREVLAGARERGWPLADSQTYLDFLRGRHDFACTPWGGPTYTVFGWQRPCYLMNDGYVASYRELLEETPWDAYGRGRDDRCAQCLVHSGYEPSAVAAVAASPRLALREALAALPVRRTRTIPGPRPPINT